MILRRRISFSIAALLALTALLLPASARQSKPIAVSLAPLELVAEDLGHLRGIAVDGTGTAFVTDVKRGRLRRVAPDGGSTIVVERLRHPAGVTVDREGRLIVVEAGRRRVLSVDTEGASTVVTAGLRHPGWVAAAPDGHLYVTAKSFASRDEDGDDEEVEPEVIVRIAPDGQVGVFAGRFRGLQGVTVTENALAVAARGQKGERHARGTLYEIPIQPDGRAGAAHSLAANAFAGPVGLAVDRLGARFVSAKSVPGQPWHRHVILKVAQDGTTTLFAEGLEDPQGLAFALDGSLYLADGDSGRVFRFHAPRAPSLDEVPPAVTNQREITLRLRGEMGARLTVLGGQFPASAGGDGAGSAVVSVPLRRNSENHLLVLATGHDGLGLTSAPLELSVTQDDEPPTVELLAPRAGALVRATIAAEARAADSSGIAEVEFRLGELMVGLDAAPPFRVSVDTAVVADGVRIMSALARDRAGNVGRASAQMTVDNTPPAVKIAAPAPGDIAGGPVEVVVEAVDATSGIARVELAVNGVSRFVAEMPPYRFELESRELAPGANVLVAAAIDRAENRGESLPVSITLSGLTVQMGQPGDGAQVPSGLLLVRGLVESRGTEVGVVVNGFAAAVQGSSFAVFVPVDPDTTVLTAVATAADGTMARHSVTIAVSPTPTQAITLLASPQSGVAPLRVTWQVINLTGRALVRFALDETGAGVFGPPMASFSEVTTTYSNPGLLFPTLQATDDQGASYTATTIVNVESPQTVTTRFQGLWTGLKARLQARDIPGAVAHLAPSLQPRFRAVFQQLGADLSAIAAAIGDIEVLEQVGDLAEAAIVQQENGTPFLYFIYFRRDSLGRWLIEEM